MLAPRVLRSSRGQALVLFALTLLLLTLMVLMTLGFGMRAKERVELQMASDTAAYSEAVVTARTFNAISVMNRAQVSHMVAMAGTQALISWSSQEYAVLRTACPGEHPDLDMQWHDADDAAATQVLSLQGTAGSMYRASLNIYASLLREHLADQQLADQLARAVNPELRAPPEGAAKSLNEVNGDNPVPEHDVLMDAARADSLPGGGCGAVGGAVCPAGGNRGVSLNATLGSLGWTWVHSREGGSASFGSGGAGRSGNFHHYNSSSEMDPSTYQTVSGLNSSAHDHPRAIVPRLCRNPTVPSVEATDAWVMSDARQYREDQHVYGVRAPPGQAPEEGQPMFEMHTLGECVSCPGIWPFSMGYNVTELQRGGSNHYGQPKLYAVLHRDYASEARRRKPDPWSLFFHFPFADNSTRAGSTFDNASPWGEMGTEGRDDVKRNQVALSAGMVYYHRPRAAAQGGGWREPPNFINPFWRATLVSPEGASDDKPANSLGAAGFTGHAAALRALDEAGYRGGSRRGARY